MSRLLIVCSAAADTVLGGISLLDPGDSLGLFGVTFVTALTIISPVAFAFARTLVEAFDQPEVLSA